MLKIRTSIKHSVSFLFSPLTLTPLTVNMFSASVTGHIMHVVTVVTVAIILGHFSLLVLFIDSLY